MLTAKRDLLEKTPRPPNRVKCSIN